MTEEERRQRRDDYRQRMVAKSTPRPLVTVMPRQGQRNQMMLAAYAVAWLIYAERWDALPPHVQAECYRLAAGAVSAYLAPVSRTPSTRAAS